MLIQEEHDIEQLQERERAVRQLESDILDVNTIFKVNFWVRVSRVFGFFDHSSCKDVKGWSDLSEQLDVNNIFKKIFWVWVG